MFNGNHKTIAGRATVFFLAGLVVASASACKRKRESTPPVAPVTEAEATARAATNQVVVTPVHAPAVPATKEQLIARRIAKLRQQGYPTTLAELHQWEMIPAGETNLAPMLIQKLSMPEQASRTIAYAKREGPLSPAHMDQAFNYGRLATNQVAGFRKVLSVEGRARFLPSPAAPDNPVPRYFADRAPRLINNDVLWQIQDRKPSIAAASIGALIRFSHFLAEEPMSIVQVGRVVQLDLAVRGLERLLHQAQLAAPQLEWLQRELAREPEDAWRRNLIGEQCLAIVLLQTKPVEKQLQLLQSLNWGEEILSLSDVQEIPAANTQQAFLDCLDALDELTSRLKEPMPKQLAHGKTIRERSRAKNMGAVAYLYAAHLATVQLEMIMKGLAIQRTSQTALAVERYRLANRGALPPTLAALVPAQLAAVPLDPFDDQPLRYKRLPKGFVVYSIGADLQDDGGMEGRLTTKSPCDLTFTIAR